MHDHCRVIWPIVALSAALCWMTPRLAAQPETLLRDGDRVVLVGGTYIERMQTHGYFETEMAARLRLQNLTFRNLGWSGDNVQGESRAVFGAIKDGYSRLLRDLKLASPSVVILHYGVVEARQGPPGGKAFRIQLARLVEDIKQLDSRVILLSPRPQVDIGSPFPAASAFNKSLDLYRAAVVDVARSSGSAVIDLDEAGSTRLDITGGGADRHRATQSRAPFRTGLTSDGLQLTASGYWLQASSLAAALGGRREPPQITIFVGQNRIVAFGAMATIDRIAAGEISITYQRDILPPVRMWDDGGPESSRDPDLTLAVKGLPPGKYVAAVHPWPVAGELYSARQLSAGVKLTTGDADRVAEMRQAIARKNVLFFHRYRPQNETYLFLFRKHEQGNNAVEIPMFDPLVESLDREIHRLSEPRSWHVVIQRRPSR
jgi:lysophospholipase L1-like esterase